MPPVLRLYEDVLSSDSAEISLPALPAHDLRRAWRGDDRGSHPAGRRGAQRRRRRRTQGRQRWRHALALGDGGGRCGRRHLGGTRRRLPGKIDRLAGNVAQGRRCCCAATASRSRRADARTYTGIRVPAFVVCMKAQSGLIPMGARPRMGPAAPGTRPGRTACSPRPRTGRRASSASWPFRLPIWAKARSSI